MKRIFFARGTSRRKVIVKKPNFALGKSRFLGDFCQIWQKLILLGEILVQGVFSLHAPDALSSSGQGLACSGGRRGGGLMEQGLNIQFRRIKQRCTFLNEIQAQFGLFAHQHLDNVCNIIP